MFERFSEAARRAVFFSRFEASCCGAQTIEPEHFLLGVLRENPAVQRHIDADGVRQAIHARLPVAEARTTSVDIPLGTTTKRIIVSAGEEADRLGSRWIECSHLLAGILREEQTHAAQVLEQFAITPAAVGREMPPPELPRLGPLAAGLAAQLARAQHHLERMAEGEADQKLKRRDWTRKEAMAHLIDLATAHHQWIVRALVEPRVTAVSYPEQEWSAAQRVELLPWMQLVEIWVQLQGLLIHLLSNVPEERQEIPIRIGLAPAVPLRELAGSYQERIEVVLGEIVTHG